MRRAFALAIALVPLLALPGPTAAGQSTPPDNSGIDQYIEDTPGAGGDRPGGGLGGDGGSATLPKRSIAALESHPEGAAALGLAAGTAPGGADRSQHSNGGRIGGGAGPAQDPGSGSGIASAVSEIAAGDSGGMGIALPIILAVSLVAAVVLGVMRRRRHRPHHP
jgi:hypothetical protein